MERALKRLGDVYVVAPAIEQSGVGHSITFLSPLMAKEVFDGDRRRGWAVEGSPADCVKLAMAEFCPNPDLVVSGINGGLNVGINVLYSGTVAGATEGAVFGLTSVAVSLEYDEHANFDQAAEMASRMIEQILKQRDASSHTLYNINIPTAALNGRRKCESCRWRPSVAGRYDRRVDPKGRHYYWAMDTPAIPEEGDTDGFAGLGARVRDAHAAADRSDGARNAGADAGLEVDVGLEH